MTMLEQELKFYEQHRHEFVAVHPRRFALIKGEELIGVFATMQEAYGSSIAKFGNVPVLIRQILPADPAHGIPAFTQGLLHARC
jgi:hypothetical protein